MGRRRLPYLSRGGHSSPDRGACVMEYVSIAAGLKFNDTPECVDENLRNLAIQLNDNLHPHLRNQLLQPWLLHFADTATAGSRRSRMIRAAVDLYWRKYRPMIPGRLDPGYGVNYKALAEHLGELFDRVDNILGRDHRAPATLDELEVVEKQRRAVIEERRDRVRGGGAV